jgi:hypothetical protein
MKEDTTRAGNMHTHTHTHTHTHISVYATTVVAAVAAVGKAL